MIAVYFLVFFFTVATCESFHDNQHLPIQKYQPPLIYSQQRYQPPQPYQQQQPYQQPYPGYYAYYPQSGKIGNPNAPGDQTDLDRQYQQWQIAVPNQQQGGVVWISAPQYGYPYQPQQSGQQGNYPPPQNGQQGNYPPPQNGQQGNYPPPSYPYPPGPPQQPAGPYPNPSPASGSQQPTVSRDTVFPSTGSVSESSTPSDNETQTQTTDPVITLSPIENPSSQQPSSSWGPTSSSSELPPTTSSTESRPSSTEDGSNSTPSGSSSSPNNSTSVETSTKPTNATSNPLLKYCKKPRGQFPANDCRKFVNCWDDVAIEQSCPNGLAFNAEKSYCDYPENVKGCGNATNAGSASNSTSSNSTSSNSTNSTGNAKCPKSYGTYRNTSNCAAFYVCVSGEPVDFICPPGTAYNDGLKVCDYPYRVNCQGSPLPPMPEESSSDNSTEVAPESSTNSSSPSSSSSSWPTSSSRPESSSPLIETSSASSSALPISSTYSVTELSQSTSSELPTSTIPSPFLGTDSSETPALPPPGVDAIGLYNFNLKKLPESVVNTGVRCYHTNVFRLVPDCSSVTICQDSLTYVVNCGPSTSFDAVTQKCVSPLRARC